MLGISIPRTWSSPGRILALTALAVVCLTVYSTRVYRDFTRVRIRVVTEPLSAVRQSVHVSLPDLSALADGPVAVIVRLRNDRPVERGVTAALAGADLGRLVVDPERMTTFNLMLLELPQDAAGLDVELRGEGDGWALEYLELANIYGFSLSPFGFVIAPDGPIPYDPAPPRGAMLLAVVLLLLSLPFFRPAPTVAAGVARATPAVVVATFFLVILAYPWTSEFKFLIALDALSICVAVAYVPALLAFPTPLRLLRPVGRLAVTGAAWLVAQRYRLAAVIAAGSFLLSVGQFHDAETGFTSLIEFGSDFGGQTVPAVRATPHFVEPGAGYDGQFYAQLALDPLIRDPSTALALDDYAYRGRRMLFAWTAFLMGLGQPRWVLEAFALQNVLCWMLLSVLMFRWLNPSRLDNLFLWLACMFSGGLQASVRSSLLEGPSLLLLVLTIVAVEANRTGVATALVALSGLGRDTNLLSGSVLVEPQHGWRRAELLRLVKRALLTVVPLTLWMAYLASASDLPGISAGQRAFSWPMLAYIAKWGEALRALSVEGWSSYERFSVHALVSLLVQLVVLAARPRWDSPWWRVGMTYGLLMLVLGPAVWEGAPGAASRVLLPMTFAFNVLLPRNLAFWPLAVLGNLTVLHGLEVFHVLDVWTSS